MTHWPTPWHLDSIHSVEQALILVLLLAPFLALWVVSIVRSRQERRDAEDAPTRDLRSAGERNSRAGVDPAP